MSVPLSVFVVSAVCVLDCEEALTGVLSADGEQAVSVYSISTRGKKYAVTGLIIVLIFCFIV
jgi:hypothetical protein